MMSEDEIIKELKKLKKPYPDFSKITIIPVKEGLAKKIEQSFVMKNSNHYRVILMEGYGKIFVEFYNVKDLNKKMDK